MEFQRQLRAGRTIAQARRRPQDDDDDPCGGGCFCFRLGLSRGTAAALALAYALIDAAWCGFFTVAVAAAAWATAVEADGTVRACVCVVWLNILVSVDLVFRLYVFGNLGVGGRIVVDFRGLLGGVQEVVGWLREWQRFEVALLARGLLLCAGLRRKAESTALECTRTPLHRHTWFFLSFPDRVVKQQ